MDKYQNEVYPARYIQVKQRERKKPQRAFILFFMIITLVLLSKASSIKNIGLFLTKAFLRNQTQGPLISEKTAEAVKKQISGTKGTFSIYVSDLNTGRDYGINEEMVVTAASINKIPILATLYYLTAHKEIDLDKIVVPQPDDIQDYGTGSIRYDPAGTAYSLQTLARLMMEKSDNTAAHILGKIIIGFDRIQTLVENWGLTQTSMADNKTSAKDISILLTKMYRGEITNKALTREMLGFMTKSDFEDRIPDGVDPSVTVYHKTGDEVGKIHDAAIVDLDGKPYFLAIFTTDISDEEKTKETMAKISKLVYDYLKEL